MTRPYPQHQSITSPLSSREKGDWGFKRPFPLVSTMGTSTPLIRVKQVDSIESITDFASASDHTLSLEKFQELRVAMTIPKEERSGVAPSRADSLRKSVFEEDMDFTELRQGREDAKRWKFEGPWLARMTEGDFLEYLEKKVCPQRAQFRALLKERLAVDLTNRQNTAAMDKGEAAPAPVTPENITEEQFTAYLRSLRSDRVTLYGLVSKFLDLAPLGQPVGIMQSLWTSGEMATESPYGKSGPPPSHPSAGISYLRTNSYMENHPVYGPQARRTPILSRVIYPKSSPSPAKLGVGGFVADTPSGDNEFNQRPIKGRHPRKMLAGIYYLDTETFGGAKAMVDPDTASVDPSGRVVLQLREADQESQLLARESKGRAEVYNDSAPAPPPAPRQRNQPADSRRAERIAKEILGESSSDSGRKEKNVVGSSKSYGLNG